MLFAFPRLHEHLRRLNRLKNSEESLIYINEESLKVLWYMRLNLSYNNELIKNSHEENKEIIGQRK
jgi:hypothetical protein